MSLLPAEPSTATRGVHGGDIVGAAGILSIGWSVFSGLDELYLFAKGTYYATNERQLDEAADHLAQAIAILGIQAVLAFLLKGRSRTSRQAFGGAGILPEAAGLIAIGMAAGVAFEIWFKSGSMQPLKKAG